MTFQANTCDHILVSHGYLTELLSLQHHMFMWQTDRTLLQLHPGPAHAV